jgi:hypothetical protein
MCVLEWRAHAYTVCVCLYWLVYVCMCVCVCVYVCVYYLMRGVIGSLRVSVCMSTYTHTCCIYVRLVSTVFSSKLLQKTVERLKRMTSLNYFATRSSKLLQKTVEPLKRVTSLNYFATRSSR